MQFVAIFCFLCATVVTVGAYFVLRRSICDIISVLFYWYALMFIVRGFFLASGLDGPFPDYLFFNHFALLSGALLLYSLWVVSLLVGALVFGDHAPGVARLLPGTHRLPHPLPLTLAVVAMTLLSVVITAIVIGRYGGVAGAITAIKFEKDLGGFYVFKQFSAIGVVLAAVAFPIFTQLAERGWSHARLRIYRLVCLACVAAAGFGCYVWGARTPIGVALIVWFGWGVIRGGRIRLVPALARGAVTIMFLYAMRLGRDILASGAAAYTLEQETLIRKFSVALNLVPLDAFMMAIRDWPDRYPFRNGEDFYNGLVGIVPRTIWANKPQFTAPGQWFRQIYEPEKANGWPFTIVGEWYVNFGVTGVIAGGLLTGWVFRAAQRRYADHDRNPVSWMMAILLVFYVFQGGMWSQSAIFYVLWLVPLFVIFHALDRMTDAIGASAGRDARVAPPRWAQ